jgi:prepilin-type N-terminal cleavage/methylation domain-containing protein
MLRERLAAADGFGLIELMIAMTIMAIAITAIVAGFSSGILAINRASQASTAGTLADRQMEFYRGLPYTSIALGSTSGADATYTGDPALVASTSTGYGGTDVTACTSGCMLAAGTTEGTYCSTAPTSFPAPCSPTQASVTGPDRRTYRVDTYIVWYCPQIAAGGTAITGATTSSPTCAGSPGPRPVKSVTVVVRSTTGTPRTLIRETSTFDQAT